MRETEKTNYKHSKFMTYLNLSSIMHKMGDNRLCDHYMKLAEEDDKVYVNPVLVSGYYVWHKFATT